MALNVHNKVKHLLACLAVAGILSMASPAAADGCYVAPPATHQIAVETYGTGATPVSARIQKGILWDKPDGYQLHLWVKVAASTDDFAWFIPFPAVPEVSEGDPLLFEDLAIASTPEFKLQLDCFADEEEYLSGGHTATSADASGGEEAVPSETSLTPSHAVSIEKEGQAGVYDYKVLSAADPLALEEWLQDEGYTIPEGLQGAIGEYIDKEWYFFVAKVIQEEVQGMELLPPLVFDIKNYDGGMTYPIKITSLSMQGPWYLFLWVISDIDDLTIGYVNFEGLFALPPYSPINVYGETTEDGSTQEGVPSIYYSNLLKKPDTLYLISSPSLATCQPSVYCDLLKQIPGDEFDRSSTFYAMLVDNTTADHCCPK